MSDTVKLYRKKPIIIEAIQLTYNNAEEVKKFIGKCMLATTFINNKVVPIIFVNNIEITCGDYIVKDIDGEFYKYKSDTFEKTYEMYFDVEELEIIIPEGKNKKQFKMVQI